MQMQEENGLTNLIYFHTDLMLVLAPDCVWVSPISTCIVPSPALCSVTRAVFRAHTPCWVSVSIPCEKMLVPRSTAALRGKFRNLGASSALHLTGVRWGNILVPWCAGSSTEEGESLCGRTPCILGMLSSMIRKVWPGRWKGSLTQVWLPRQGNDANSVALCSGKQRGCPPWELCALLSHAYTFSLSFLCF